jgi:hypothetical protein
MNQAKYEQRVILNSYDQKYIIFAVSKLLECMFDTLEHNKEKPMISFQIETAAFNEIVIRFGKNDASTKHNGISHEKLKRRLRNEKMDKENI